MTTNPYTLLKETVNPILAQVLEDERIYDDPILSLFNFESLVGEGGKTVQTSTSGELELYQFKSLPAVVIGDVYQYQTGVKSMIQGKIKAKKFTIQVRISEDQRDRISKAVMNGTMPLIERELRTEMRNSIAYLRSQVIKYVFDPWGGVTTGADYDSAFKGFFAISSTGTLSNPSDLNSSAGTAEDLSAVVSLYGSNQTLYNVDQIVNQVITNFTKIDAVTNLAVPYKQIYMGVHPKIMAILKTKKDLYNATTKQQSQRYYYEDFVAAGIIPVVHTFFDSSAAITEDGTTTLVFFADPQEDFIIYDIPPPEGDVWTDWFEEHNVGGEYSTISFERHKKLEFACQPQGYWVNTSATAGSVFKKVCHVKVTTYNNAS